MPLPKFSARYPDIRQVFDAAIAAGGARYRLNNGGKATNWRQRAYYFRKLLWAELNTNNVGPPIPTPYEGIRITIDPEDSSVAIIHVNSAQLHGEIEGLTGGPVSAPDPLLAEAEAFKRKLMGGL